VEGPEEPAGGASRALGAMGEPKPPEEEHGEQVADAAIEVLHRAAGEQRPLDVEERKVVRELRKDPVARREFRRTRFWVAALLLGAVALVTAAVYAFVLYLVG
jgi:hypothetical protein